MNYSGQSLQFFYNEEIVTWNFEKVGEKFLVNCQHLIFVEKYGSPSIVVNSIDHMFNFEFKNNYYFFSSMVSSYNTCP